MKLKHYLSDLWIQPTRQDGRMLRRLCMLCKHKVSALDRMIPVLCTLLVLGAFTDKVLAQSTAEPPVPCTRDGFHSFDFWLGKWDVHVASGQLAGHNDITREQGGCVLIEHWRNQGGGGMSINYYAPLEDRWHQLWVSPGVIIDIQGGLIDTSMVLEGFISYGNQALPKPFRGTWTPLADGRVRQFFEERRDGQWQTWFEGFYSRRADES